MSETIADLRVLVVEDQADARALLRGMMNDMGITQVFEANNGRDALSFMDSAFDFVDIVVCDWNMPHMSGLELLRQLRSVYPELPFLMITGRGDMSSVIEAKSVGVTGYIRKPFSPAQLEVKLRVIAQRSQTLQQRA